MSNENSYYKTKIVQTEAYSVAGTICQYRPGTFKIPLIGRPEIKRSSGQKATRSVKMDSNANEITTILLPRSREKRKRLLTESSDKKVKKEKIGKQSISAGSMYQRDVKKECIVPLSLPRDAGRKRKRSLSDARNKKFKKEKHEQLSNVGSTYQRDVTEDVLDNMNRLITSDLPSGVVNKDKKICKTTLAENSTIQTPPVRCPAVIRFGEFEVQTCYSCPFPLEEGSPRLVLCEYCLKYTKCQSVFERHMRHCNWRTPPGTEIYRSEDISVFEVDAKVDKTYCLTLCRVGKLFLDIKLLDYDVERFLFYIVTKNDGFGCHLVGYFSKLKNNEDNHNVACIVTLPQYRRQGYGRILIELSYLLSQIEKQPGTPEKPLSDLGKLTYHAYWKGVIFEYLHNHRGVEFISIDDISSKTGLIREDIIDTLKTLNMVVEVYNDITICIDWRIVDGYIKKKNKLEQIRIEPGRLKWTPPIKSSNLLCSPDGKGSQRVEKTVLIKCIS